MVDKVFSNSYLAGYLLHADDTAIIHVRFWASKSINHFTKINVQRNNNKFSVDSLLPDIGLLCAMHYIKKYNSDHNYLITNNLDEESETQNNNDRYLLHCIVYPDNFNNIKFHYAVNEDVNKEYLQAIGKENNLSETANIIARPIGYFSKVDVDAYPTSIQFDDISEYYPNSKFQIYSDLNDLMICNESINCTLK